MRGAGTEARAGREEEAAVGGVLEKAGQAAVVEARRHVEEEKRRPLRPRHAEPVGRRFPQPPVRVAGPGDPGVSRPLENPQGRQLGGRRRGIDGVGRELQRLGDGRGGAGDVPDAVSRHAVGLREGMDREGALGREGEARHVLAPVDVVLVDLVEEKPEIVAPGECDERLEPASRDHAPRRVARGVDVERDRAGREGRLDGGDRRLRRFRHAEERDVDGNAAGHLHVPLDERPVRSQDQDLVARRDDRPDDRREPRRPAPRDEDVRPLDRDAGAGAEAVDDGVDERREALRRRVPVHSGVRSDREVLHPAALGRLQEGVADVKGIDLALVRREAVEDRRVDGALDRRGGRRELRRTRHGGGMLAAPVA